MEVLYTLVVALYLLKGVPLQNLLITLLEMMEVLYTLNTALRISFKDISTGKFYNNVAIRNGAAVHSTDTTISLKSNAYIEFDNNAATRGGAIYSYYNSFISLKDFLLQCLVII